MSDPGYPPALRVRRSASALMLVRQLSVEVVEIAFGAAEHPVVMLVRGPDADLVAVRVDRNRRHGVAEENIRPARLLGCSFQTLWAPSGPAGKQTSSPAEPRMRACGVRTCNLAGHHQQPLLDVFVVVRAEVSPGGSSNSRTPAPCRRRPCRMAPRRRGSRRGRESSYPLSKSASNAFGRVIGRSSHRTLAEQPVKLRCGPRGSRSDERRASPSRAGAGAGPPAARSRAARARLARRRGSSSAAGAGGDVTFSVDELAEATLARVRGRPRAAVRVLLGGSRPGRAAGDETHVLVVDPIDGTRPAMAGLESACVAVALAPLDRR